MVLIFLIAGCSVNAIYHDEDKAIEDSNLFLKALIKEDFAAAYLQISDRLKQSVPLERFKSDLKLSLEQRGTIEKAVFDSFQAVPGQMAIQLYYNVFHRDAKNILYHFVLEGDGKTGYKIVVFDIGNQMPYPPNMKYIGVNRIKKDKLIEVVGD